MGGGGGGGGINGRPPSEVKRLDFFIVPFF